ncbi:MAG: insulinase family protein [Candidatus Andeanibacterium colombiense]|uniref:Insulinase family protein n=1 Tax=Candidatus Andeanibacterium colombiense TaxID=3121345 RepID=A0AAJ5X6C6_9SPHN|nr:MAG: insulinase family protein [Sphingomonadaceae bacterium]
MKRIVAALAAFCLSTSLVAPAFAKDAPAASAAARAPRTKAEKATWAFEKSDLPLDPSYRFGRLPNGLRYVIRQNSTPAGMAEVRLVVHAGSIDETDAEQGYAHFIEHMAFNGSTHVPEDEMVKLLEREGLAFGADTNASTNFEVTTYQLDLPRNDPALLDTALMLMRETGSELLFDQGAIDREKGVVLSEKRVRDTYVMHNTMDSFRFLYPGAHFPDRWPIGTTEALQAATTAKLKALYARTYTPLNSVVIVVGDFDPALVEQKIRDHFSGWQAAPTPDDPDAGPVDPALKGKTDVWIDPALSEKITASRNRPWVYEPDTVANRFTNLLRQVGYGIVNRRLDRLANSETPPFRDAGFGTGDIFQAGQTTNLVVTTAEGEWAKGLPAAVTEYRRALAYGFTQAEIDEQLADIRTSLENTVATADTRYNATFTGAAIGLVNERVVPTTPQSSLDRFNAAVPKITPAAVLAAMTAEAAPLDDPMIRFEGRTPPQGGADALRAAWNAAYAAPIARGGDAASGKFAYSDFGAPGAIASDTRDPRLGIREIRFANGVRLNLKHTDLRKDRISFALNLDGGDMLATRDNPLATGLVNGLPWGGLGKHSFDDLQTIMAGKTVAFNIGSGDQTFQMQGGTTPRDLELQLDLLTAAITDPGYRKQGEEKYRRSVADFFASMNATPGAALGNALPGFVSDNDPRFTVQPEAAYLALDFAKLKADIGDRLAHGAIELALVGDFDETRAIALVAKTLGALPAREPDFQPYTANRTRSFTIDRSPRTVYHTGQPDQALLNMSWPTRDDSDPVENLQLQLLDRVIQNELMDKLREKLGQTYSPSVSASQSRTYPGYGTFTISASLDPKDVPAARQAVIETLTELRAKPIDDDTLLRARRPMLEYYENMLKTNDGWMALVDRAQTESDYIDRYLAGKKRLESFTADDVEKLAQRYLDPAQRLEVVALPKPKDAAAP